MLLFMVYTNYLPAEIKKHIQMLKRPHSGDWQHLNGKPVETNDMLLYQAYDTWRHATSSVGKQIVTSPNDNVPKEPYAFSVLRYGRDMVLYNESTIMADKERKYAILDLAFGNAAFQHLSLYNQLKTRHFSKTR